MEIHITELIIVNLYQLIIRINSQIFHITSLHLFSIPTFLVNQTQKRVTL
jgi:hypothetical protein